MVSAHVDGLIIVDESRKPIVQTSFHGTPAAYPLLHLDAFNNALEKARLSSTSYPKKIDSVLPVNIPASPDRSSSVCCHVERAGIYFLCPVSADVDPAFVFAFVETFISILEDYLGTVSSSSIKDHFDVVYQLLEEMLDNGIPLTTEPNTLKDIVLPPSLMNKILSVAGVAGLPTSTPAPFSSPIPWRKTGLRYNNNEIYFDIIETLDAVVSNSGKVITREVYGKIHSTSRLSGTPDLLMAFGGSQVMVDATFHPCVRIARFISKRELSFVPPDGSFTLMEYRVDRTAGSHISATGMIPITLKPIVQINDDGGTFDISATSKLPSNRALENVTVSFYLGEGSGSVTATMGLGISSTGMGAGGTLSWNIPVLDSHPRSIKGAWITSVLPPRPSRSMHVTFQLANECLSGIRVDYMKVMKEAYKAFKGVRTSAKGEIEWRV
ncbi:clathrin adaptor mu subunit [Clavulina sp. PMI_390]|nr:clathrin adaptor mu subunit [Clavulina sp. PMI_390]